MIEAEYPVDPTDRTLLGHSWGADFALYALFQRPTLFQRYVVASPEPNLDDEQTYAARHDSLPVRLHLVVEDMQADDVTRLESFAALLESRGFAGLTLTHQVLAQTTHCAMVPSPQGRGLETTPDAQSIPPAGDPPPAPAVRIERAPRDVGVDEDRSRRALR